MASKIQHLCRRRGISQAALESAAGLPVNRVSKWAAGNGEPTARQALRIARVLDVPLEYLADDERDEPPAPPDAAEAELLRIARRVGVEAAIDRILAVSPRSDPPGSLGHVNVDRRPPRSPKSKDVG